jgi:PTH1 family peptidyl-tRNA hydrolase
MKIIVGLGNPGKKYEWTRHNIGFQVIDHLSQKWGIRVEREKWNGLVGEGQIYGEKVVLLKPLTYMNLSGESVRPAVDWLKADLDDLLVVYDDMDLPTGKLRLRLKGSSGGHNGMKSIIQHLGSDQFKRIRMGIGRPQNNMSIPDYVLSPFNPEEKPLVDQMIEKATEAIECWIKETFLIAMNQFN